MNDAVNGMKSLLGLRHDLCGSLPLRDITRQVNNLPGITLQPLKFTASRFIQCGSSGQHHIGFIIPQGKFGHGKSQLTHSAGNQVGTLFAETAELCFG